MLVKRIICLIAHFALALLLMLLASLYPLGLASWVVGLFLYHLVLLVLYRLIPHHHVNGMWHLAQEKWDLAYLDFEKSNLFFERYAWLDSFGFILLFNFSGHTYRDSAILNQALIRIKEGKLDEALHLYHRVLDQNPKNKLAQNGIRYIQKISKA